MLNGDSSYGYSAQIKSVPENTFKYARTIRNMIKTDIFTVRLSIPQQIPLFILFRASSESDKASNDPFENLKVSTLIIYGLSFKLYENNWNIFTQVDRLLII